MTYEEELQQLEEDLKDAQKTLEQDEENLSDALNWVKTSKVRWAEAIIRLDNFKKEHEPR